jgi:hypothetical protein
MRLLIAIPCLYGAQHTEDAIESVLKNENVHLLLIDNGAEPSVKEVIKKYDKRTDVFVIKNQSNVYVNPAWNQIMAFFLKWSGYDRLCIMNSDLIIDDNFTSIIENFAIDNPNDIPVPVISSDSNIFKQTRSEGFEEVHEGTAGVFIVLSREQCEKVYPIPESIKVWFGDNWIYDGLRKLGSKTIVVKNMICYHSGSQNVSRVKGISEIIEQDKIEWSKIWAS